MAKTVWRLRGEEIGSCNCSWGCPCQFNALPTHGRCDGIGVCQIAWGHYGEVSLDGTRFAFLLSFPGAVHEGKGTSRSGSRRSVREANDESVPVRHPHFGECLGIHRVALPDELVEGENVSGQRVNFLVGERSRLRPWHGAANVIEESRRKGPEVRDGLLRLDCLDRIAANQPAVDAAFALRAVARGAFCRVDASAVGGRAAAGRKTGAVPQHVDVPGRNVRGPNRLSKIGGLGEGNPCTESKRKRDGESEKATRIHASPPRCARSTNW